MAARMIWDGRQGFGQLRFGGGEGRREVGYKQAYARDRVRAEGATPADREGKSREGAGVQVGSIRPSDGNFALISLV